MRPLLVLLLLFPGLLRANVLDLTFHSVAGGVSIGGEGTNTATLDYGTVSAFDPLPLGVGRTTGASDYTLSTDFGVRVVLTSGTSPDYVLQARLQSAHPLAWTVDGVTMTTSFQTVATLQPYGSILSHELAFTVPFSTAAGGIATDFELMAIAN